MSLNINGLEAKKTILPVPLQRNHHNAIAQFKGQESPSTSKKRQCLKTWHENEWRTKYHKIYEKLAMLEVHKQTSYFVCQRWYEGKGGKLLLLSLIRWGEEFKIRIAKAYLEWVTIGYII